MIRIDQLFARSVIDTDAKTLTIELYLPADDGADPVVLHSVIKQANDFTADERRRLKSRLDST